MKRLFNVIITILLFLPCTINAQSMLFNGGRKLATSTPYLTVRRVQPMTVRTSYLNPNVRVNTYANSYLYENRVVNFAHKNPLYYKATFHPLYNRNNEYNYIFSHEGFLQRMLNSQHHGIEEYLKEPKHTSDPSSEEEWEKKLKKEIEIEPIKVKIDFHMEESGDDGALIINIKTNEYYIEAA